MESFKRYGIPVRKALQEISLCSPDPLADLLKTAVVMQFVNRWRKTFPGIPVEMYDERYTSVLAHQAMIDGGLRKKARQDKALVDEISATIILQDYLESRRH